MQIKQELLDYVMEINQVHQPASIEGTYDGENGTLAMTFVGDTNTYAMDFTYDGDSYNSFRELLCVISGQFVSAHNTHMGVPNRDAFVASVTE
jgi:hypothetical protein